MRYAKRTLLHRLFPAVLSLLLLAGCGASGGNAGKSAPESGADGGTAAASPPDRQAENAGEETQTAPETAARPDSLPAAGLVTIEDYHYDEDAEQMSNRIELTMPVPSDETREAYPALSAALDRYRADCLEMSQEAYREREGILEEIRAEEDLSEYHGLPFYGVSTAYVRRSDSQAFSAVLYSAEYAGGIHGMYGFTALNLDAATGEAVSLDSLLSDAGREELNTCLGAELDRLYPELSPGHMVADYELNQYTFTLEPDGVTFWFSPYQIASYADGCQTAKLFFRRDGELFNGAYDASDSWWCMELPGDVPALFSPDGGTTVRNVSVWGEMGETGDAYGKLCFLPDGPADFLSRGIDSPGFDGLNIFQYDVYSYSLRPSYCHTPAGDFLMVLTSADNDYEGICVYSLEDGGVRSAPAAAGPKKFAYLPREGEDVANHSACRTALTNPMDLPLTMRGSLFGTWMAEGTYVFAPDGITLNGEYLYLPAGPDLTLNLPLTVRPVSMDNLFFTFDDDVTLPAGTEIRGFATDGEGTMFFRTRAKGAPEEAGSPWGFSLSCDDPEAWPRTVNGVPEEELFDGLLYVG